MGPCCGVLLRCSVGLALAGLRDVLCRLGGIRQPGFYSVCVRDTLHRLIRQSMLLLLLLFGALAEHYCIGGAVAGAQPHFADRKPGASRSPPAHVIAKQQVREAFAAAQQQQQQHLLSGGGCCARQGQQDTLSSSLGSAVTVSWPSRPDCCAGVVCACTAGWRAWLVCRCAQHWWSCISATMASGHWTVASQS